MTRDLERRAEATIRRTIRSLPEDLRGLARGIPTAFEPRVGARWLEDGVAEDSLGLFSGPALDEPTDPDCLESPLITLFLDELADYCAEEGLSFEDEVRVTWIHEFGHYLGLEEDALAERGLG